MTEDELPKAPRSTAIWPTRRDLKGCMVSCDWGERIVISAPGAKPMYLDRQEARLLARRINQCLDATVKR